MEQARAVLPFVKSLDEKYNVLYVNTPWDAMDASTLSKFPASSITPENAACFMWVDSYTAAKAAKLIDEWGFTFHSVYQVLDIAKYPWMEKASAVAADAAAPAATDAATATAATDDATSSEPKGDSAEKNKKRATRKPRAPPISAPHWWSTPASDALTPSRPTTEQLWLAVKGDPSKLFTSVTLAFNVVNRPDIGKKSRSKKPNSSDKWETERPREFLDDIMRHLTPEAKVLNVFGSAINDSVDSWGPGVPGGYLSSMKSNSGVVGVVNKILRSLKKTQLHELCLKLPKVLQEEEDAALAEISTWAPIETAISAMPLNPGYDFRDDGGSIKPWVVKLVHGLSQNNMTNFTLLHSKKKKRKVTADPNPNRQRHGIASKSVVSKELTDFLGLKEGETIARTQVVSLINKYIAAENLKDTVKKNQINLDDKLRELLAPPDGFGVITFFNICRLLKPHFPKSKKAIKEENAKKEKEQQAKGGGTSVGHVDKKACQ